MMTKNVIIKIRAYASIFLFSLCLMAQSAVQAQEIDMLIKGGHGDGAGPGAALVRDGAGNFYGATVEGGTSNTGTVFKITSSGVITVLYSFAGGGDAANPIGGLLIDGGYLYGTTVNGGTSNQGTVFRLPMH